MTVAVLIPFRADSVARAQVFDYVLDWWRLHHPSYEVVIGVCAETQPDGSPAPWVKADAYADALRGTTADVLVMTDADVLLPGVAKAVTAVAFQEGDWCRSHLEVIRLNRSATQLIMDAGATTPAYHLANEPMMRETWPYQQHAAGAGTVVSRELYEQVPHDSRFKGWGHEDTAWGLALEAVRPGREAPAVPARCLHLWHPPQRRIMARVGSLESKALLDRYVTASHAADPAEMQSLLDEFIVR